MLARCLTPRFMISPETAGVFFFNRRWNGNSTIFALSSGHGKCGVAVIRISGSQAIDALKQMTNITKLEPRKAFLRNICDPDTREVIDKGLCLWFPGPNSFTGEDSVEFQIHGGSAVIAAVSAALSKLKFAHALPGEFTRRAFYNNKLDLTEIEGLADLIHAETELQRKQAYLQVDGSLSKLYNKWRKTLLQSIAHVEAYIDFSEDDNIEADIMDKCNNVLKVLNQEIKRHLSDGRKGEILREGVRTVILGEPNVGKSSLLNYLVQREAAIVTPIPGTTRDIVELNLNIFDYPVILADTAGLRKETTDIVEIEGIHRAKNYTKGADFVILLANSVSYLRSKKKYDEFIIDYVERLGLNDLLLNNGKVMDHCIVVMNKIDLLEPQERDSLLKDDRTIFISCAREEGLQKFSKRVAIHLKNLCGNPCRENPTVSQTRHRIHLTNCSEHIDNYFDLIKSEERDIVLAAQEIRNAMRELGLITGYVSVEQILDVIFKDFCIGK
ncbi:tRNA modification GTPase GTPBP3, mitochondrial isoform X1 [Neodiprion lecontei]|uniref:tRNA modification GTPase GTPBP3, mitochondrial isoform X1 n=2 Tax=Neodiprion lecontei TaxID=441921 RepID=A0A6J0C8Y7_NEOLC|nr:tRNA modification GTPase GTPBP3, mitochondrial isoform X1 [Neodiprion lecontei]